MRQQHPYRLVLPLALAVAVGSAASAAQVIKLGYVDMNRVFNNYFKTDTASDDLAKEVDDLRKELEERQKEIEKRKDEIQIKGNILSKKRKDALENEISDKFEELTTFGRQADIKLRKMTGQKTQAIVKDIRQIVQQIGTSEGYAIIFDRKVVLYAAPAFDLTERVLDELNKNRPATQPEARSVPTDTKDEG